MPGMGKSGKRRRDFSRLIFALASSAEVEEEAVGCRPEASWAAAVEDVDAEASGLVARLPWGSEAGGMVEKGKEEKEEGRARRGGERGRSLSKKKIVGAVCKARADEEGCVSQRAGCT